MSAGRTSPAGYRHVYEGSDAGCTGCGARTTYWSALRRRPSLGSACDRRPGLALGRTAGSTRRRCRSQLRASRCRLGFTTAPVQSTWHGHPAALRRAYVPFAPRTPRPPAGVPGGWADHGDLNPFIVCLLIRGRMAAIAVLVVLRPPMTATAVALVLAWVVVAVASPIISFARVQRFNRSRGEPPRLATRHVVPDSPATQAAVSARLRRGWPALMLRWRG